LTFILITFYSDTFHKAENFTSIFLTITAPVTVVDMGMSFGKVKSRISQKNLEIYIKNCVGTLNTAAP